MMYEALFPKVKTSRRIANSMRNLPHFQASTDTLPINQSREFLKGDSIYHKSIDETQAGTDVKQNSSMLPSIMPAMKSVQSTDLFTPMDAGKSAIINMTTSPDSTLDENLLVNSSKWPRHQQTIIHPQDPKVRNLNQKSFRNMQTLLTNNPS